MHGVHILDTSTRGMAPQTGRREMMANIYSLSGALVTGGLRGSTACDEAIDAALSIADDRGVPVLLEDDDGDWVVYPRRSADKYDGDIDGAQLRALIDEWQKHSGKSAETD